MSALIMPPMVEWNAARERLSERHAELHWFESQLKELDPYLELVKANENVREQGMIPGYWHVKRRNPIGIDTYLALTGPEGEFSEPHSGFINQLREEDLQRDGGWDDLMRKVDAEETASRRHAEDQRAGLKAEFVERYNAYANPGVSMTNQGKGWKNRAAARTA